MLFLCLGIAYAAFALFSYQRDLPIMCPFRRLTGLRCPLCGLTTATGYLLHGDPRKALRAHALAPFALAAAVLWYMRSVVGLLSRASERAAI
jgi:hypothetical protein